MDLLVINTGKLRSSLIIYILALDGSNLPLLVVDINPRLLGYLRRVNRENGIEISHT